MLEPKTLKCLLMENVGAVLLLFDLICVAATGSLNTCVPSIKT